MATHPTKTKSSADTTTVSKTRASADVTMKPKSSEKVSKKPPKNVLIENLKRDDEDAGILDGLKVKMAEVFPSFRDYTWKPKNAWEKIFYPGTKANFIASILGTTLMCHIVGSILFFFYGVKKDDDTRRLGIVTSIAAMVLTSFILLFRTIRIVWFIAVPSLMSSKLRNMLLVTIIAFSLQYSALNISSNIRSSVEGIACVKERVRALADELRDSANRKLQEVPVDEAQALMDKTIKPIDDIKMTLRKVDESVSNMLEWQRRITNKLNGLLHNCSIIAQQPFFICTNKLNEFYHACLDSTFEFVCEPILLLKKTCYLTRFLTNYCDWPGEIKKTIKEGVGKYVKSSMHDVIDFTKNTTVFRLYAKVNDTTHNIEQAYDTLNFTIAHNYTVDQKMHLRLDDFRKLLRDEVSTFQTMLSWLNYICESMVTPMITIQLIWAVLYVVRYNRYDRFDNYYITEEFLQIDRNREAIHTKKIFPLSKAEKSAYIRALSWRISTKEKVKLGIRIATLILGILLPVMFVIFDILSYTLLNAGYEFFHSNNTQIEKPNIYQLKISGQGFLNALLSNILEVFQPVNDLTNKKDELWRECFSEPSPPNYYIIRWMIFMFIAAFIICFIEIYVTRVKHAIAAYYFPQRRRPRALYLYKEILEKRKNILSQTLQMAAEKVERLRIKKAKTKETDQTEKPPELEVNLLDVKTKQCVRCGRIDLKLTNASNTRICVNCKTLYCVDCFSVRRKCLDCKWPLQQIAKSTEFYVDSSCSDSDN